MEKTTMSFMSACKDFFGVAPNQTPIMFGKELQALTNEDRKEIADGLVKKGYSIDPSTIERKAA